jgi:putative sterol carrier protein
MFLRLLGLAGRRAQVPEEARRVTLHLHLQLTGPDGGDVQVDVVEGRVRVARGVPRPPTAVVTMSSATFLELISGRIDMATAGMLGKVRVEGEALAGMFFQGVFTTYRANVKRGGGLMRRLDDWLTAPTREKGAAA